MKKNIIKMDFIVTETLQNGKEYRHKKSVYTAKQGGDLSQALINSAMLELRDLHYYDIEFSALSSRKLVVI